MIVPLHCSLTLFIDGISGVLSSFSRISPQNATNFSISAYMFCPCLYFFKKVLLVSFKVSIIHYSPDSINEVLEFDLFAPKFDAPIQLSLYSFNILVAGSTPPINFLSSIVSSLWLPLHFFEFFNKCWLLVFVT